MIRDAAPHADEEIERLNLLRAAEDAAWEDEKRRDRQKEQGGTWADGDPE